MFSEIDPRDIELYRIDMNIEDLFIKPKQNENQEVIHFSFPKNLKMKEINYNEYSELI